jgi:hypothetical protein
MFSLRSVNRFAAPHHARLAAHHCRATSRLEHHHIDTGQLRRDPHLVVEEVPPGPDAQLATDALQTTTFPTRSVSHATGSLTI